MEPLGNVIELPSRGRIVAFPTLRAAAGAAGTPAAGAPEAEEVVLPVRTRSDSVFAVRATGDSMNGGSDPIRDGDWLVFRYARGVGVGAVEGRIALVQIEDGTGDGAYQVKRIVRKDGRWMLASDNPSSPSFDASERSVPIATLVERVHPETLGPDIGERIEDGTIGTAFGIDREPKNGRASGHLFVLVEAPGQLIAPDRVKIPVRDRRPGETAFVLAHVDDAAWRYCGVGRWDPNDEAWAIPDVDFHTWKAFGAGRSASRRLNEEHVEHAREIVKSIVERFSGRVVARGGKRCRVVGKAEQGGVRIDGGPGGFNERTVSLTDLAWVLTARADAAASGGVLDEARVNRVRYLEGTPKGSTRWIDTGWAIMLLSALEEREDDSREQ